MGLSSAMATSLTGLTAAEATISVVGNNLANANTVGFKSSRVSFATQYLQTLSLGSAPGDTTGGTNPRQVGLGVLVSEISPDHTQGTLEISSRATDLAIQGDGFFIVEGNAGETLYQRNGEFQFNSANELVTTAGNRVMGYGIDDDFEIQRTTLVPISVPLGSEQVAEATQNVYLEGSLSPDGDISTLGTTLQSAILGDGSYTQPLGGPDATSTPSPDTTQITPTPVIGGTPGGIETGQYIYRFVYQQDNGAGTVYSSIAGANESSYDNQVTVDITADDSTVDFTYNVSNPDWTKSEPNYRYLNVYRYQVAVPAPADPPFYQVASLDMTDPANYSVPGTTMAFTDDVSQAAAVAQPQLDDDEVTGTYEYYVTFSNADGESRPSELTGNINLVNGRVLLDNLPTPPTPDPDGWSQVNIYRSQSGDTSQFYKMGSIPTTAFAGGNSPTFLDYMTDANLTDTTRAGYAVLDMDGPKIRDNTLLVDVINRDGTTYENVFTAGTTLVFSPKKGSQTTAEREMAVTATTTMADLSTFMAQTMGIQKSDGSNPASDIPPGEYPNPSTGTVSTHDPGVWVDAASGRMIVLGNTGEGNALSIDLADLQARDANGVISNTDLPFSRTQTATGESATTDYIVYDSLGMPITVSMTCTLVDRDNAATTYRWYADSADNDPLTGANIAVGTGLLTFDGEGNFISASEETVTIDRRHIASASPLQFDLDFAEVSGLATSRSTINVSRQDGSAPGVLTSFMVGEDGIVSGIFSNGVSRDLGQLQLARFSNPQGLEQMGENMFQSSVNSGLPVQGDPGTSGIGGIISGALELSNTDIGKDLIKLILSSTTYRANTRVISTSQEMLNELLSIRTG